MANVIGLAPEMAGAIRMALLAEKPNLTPRFLGESEGHSWQDQEACYHGGHWAQKERKTLGSEAGGQAGLAFQLNCRGSGNAVEFPNISSHIPAPSKSHPRGNRDLGPLA